MPSNTKARPKPISYSKKIAKLSKSMTLMIIVVLPSPQKKISNTLPSPESKYKNIKKNLKEFRSLKNL